MGRHQYPDITARGFVDPTRGSLPSVRTRSNFAWVAGDISPASSRKSVPSWAASNRPLSQSIGAVNAPFSCPTSSLSRSVSVNAAQLTGMKRLLGARTTLMDGPGHQLLFGSGLAGDQYGSVCWGDSSDPIPHGKNRRAATEDFPGTPSNRSTVSLRRSFSRNSSSMLAPMADGCPDDHRFLPFPFRSKH